MGYHVHEIPSGNLTWLLKMAIEIVDLPIDSMVIFQFAMLVYQRLIPSYLWGPPLLDSKNDGWSTTFHRSRHRKAGCPGVRQACPLPRSWT